MQPSLHLSFFFLYLLHFHNLYIKLLHLFSRLNRSSCKKICFADKAFWNTLYFLFEIHKEAETALLSLSAGNLQPGRLLRALAGCPSFTA